MVLISRFVIIFLLKGQLRFHLKSLSISFMFLFLKPDLEIISVSKRCERMDDSHNHLNNGDFIRSKKYVCFFN